MAVGNGAIVYRNGTARQRLLSVRSALELFSIGSYPNVMTEPEDTFDCEECGAVVTFGDARRSKTMGGLDPTTWQTLCCPECGTRLKTVYVGE